jgi:hypothetical protein
MLKNNPGENTYGLVYDSKNPQIVGFGKSRFGNKLYKQMGGAYLNQPLVGKNTVMDLFGGATQVELPRPRSVPNKNIYIGQVQDYNPIKFGRKKIGEGSVISLTKKNKIKLK